MRTNCHHARLSPPTRSLPARVLTDIRRCPQYGVPYHAPTTRTSPKAGPARAAASSNDRRAPPPAPSVCPSSVRCCPYPSSLVPLGLLVCCLSRPAPPLPLTPSALALAPHRTTVPVPVHCLPARPATRCIPPNPPTTISTLSSPSSSLLPVFFSFSFPLRPANGCRCGSVRTAAVVY